MNCELLIPEFVDTRCYFGMPQVSYLVCIFSAAMRDSSAGPGRHWSAGVAPLGPVAKVHSLFGSCPSLDTPAMNTTTTCQA